MATDEIDGRLDDLAAGLAPRRGAGPGEISLRQLTKHAAAVIDDLERTGPLVITRSGRPVARLSPLGPAEPASRLD